MITWKTLDETVEKRRQLVLQLLNELKYEIDELGPPIEARKYIGVDEEHNKDDPIYFHAQISEPYNSFEILDSHPKLNKRIANNKLYNLNKLYTRKLKESNL